MEAMDIQAVESKLSDVTVTAIPMNGKSVHKDLNIGGNANATISTVPASSPSSIGKDKDNGMSKYAQLLAVIEEMVLTSGDQLIGEGDELQNFILYLIQAFQADIEGPLINSNIKTDDVFKPMGVTWVNKWRWHTGYSADSVEWCPVEPHRNVLVCGTYQLDKKADGEINNKQKRLGKIYLFVINEDTTELNPIQTVDTSGILDQKWCYHTIQNYPILAIVTSDGDVQFFRLVEDNGTLNLNLWFSHLIGSDVLVLSLDWSTNMIRMDEPCVVVSDSAGKVTILKVTSDGVQNVGFWDAHGFEAWIAAFNYWNPDVFYSGGDDCLFKCYDVRVKDAAVVVNKSHEAGVTTVRSHISMEYQLLTGSYDEKVRLWDARKLKSCITEKDVGGGVWRLKWHPYKPYIVLAACMYGGFRVLHVADEFNVACDYLEHESIAYGADWIFDRCPLVATCSFYDCDLHVSEVNINSE